VTSGGKGTCDINIGRFKTYKARTEFDKEGEKRRRKRQWFIQTVLKLACKNINGLNPGSVAAGGVG
jgi:hypothetical protein